jgi:hypothetical protein
MSALIEYVQSHTDRSACHCGKCIDAEKPVEKRQWDVVELVAPPHTVNMFFFEVSAVDNPTAEEFVRLTNEHKGVFCEATPLDGGEHSYLELGGWIGDQGLAMQYMALGKMLGLWQVMHPGMILNVNDPDQKLFADQLAAEGMVSILGKQS